jgi:dihydrofolate reductase
VIRAIAAVDDRLGVGTDAGIPWSVPADVEHFHSATASTDVLMGYATYTEFAAPMEGRTNFVATRGGALRDGFEPVTDTVGFVEGYGPADLWIIGGAALFSATLALTEELYLTRIAGDYACTKFFPPFEADFRLVSDQPTPADGDVPAFRFQVWRRPPTPTNQSAADGTTSG